MVRDDPENATWYMSYGSKQPPSVAGGIPWCSLRIDGDPTAGNCMVMQGRCDSPGGIELGAMDVSCTARRKPKNNIEGILCSIDDACREGPGPPEWIRMVAVH